MILGITFEEKILKETSLKNYIQLLHEYKINLLELSPNFIDYDLAFYRTISDKIKDHNFLINFHLPNFADENLDVTNFNGENKKYFLEYFENLNKVFDLKNLTSTLVFHGAKYETHSKSKAFNKTLSFIRFTLDYFNKKNYNLTLSIETLNQNKEKVIGDSRKDLVKIIKTIDHHKLKICWDITHDYLNLNKIILPNGLFFEAINHCHVHGFKNNKTHQSISENSVLFPAIKFAIKNDIPINIELLMQDNYLKLLKKDISKVKSLS